MTTASFRSQLVGLLLFLFFTSFINGQVIYTQQDADICKSKFNLAVEKKLINYPINEVIVEIGKSFLGTEYEAHTLDQDSVEKLVIHLTGLDCYTFLESSLVFARCIKENKLTFKDYQRELINIRYRDGKLSDYLSRLHYFSDWIYDIDKRGIGENITQKIGGIPYNKKINFMSTHQDLYKQLKGNPKFLREIIQIEKNISSRENYYIPEDSIAKCEERIQSGDIIGITTNVKGLDIAHTGIAIRMEDGRIHFLHAPDVGHKVQITDKPLADYIKGNKKQTGIMVLRVNEPQ
ncbi:N-acetylmuramoyl-L-alanine amidase-like domain-containing protein [Melioribacteraceae bacterium 4301-Me]|uniref:N-acetylmuramoyl-L-alanine amidase-like domain-containing protein n=1 Tax=Pyranulibacter aquaticus TaxID=3163344 RepID=UPI003594AA66